MLEASWEGLATQLANSTASTLPAVLEGIISQHQIDVTAPSKVIFARDTRPSGPTLVAALQVHELCVCHTPLLCGTDSLFFVARH